MKIRYCKEAASHSDLSVGDVDHPAVYVSYIKRNTFVTGSADGQVRSKSGRRCL